MCGVIHDMGMLTASSQLRSSGRQGSANTDALILFGTHCSWTEPVINYAKKYAAQVRKYYTAFNGNNNPQSSEETRAIIAGIVF